MYPFASLWGVSWLDCYCMVYFARCGGCLSCCSTTVYVTFFVFWLVSWLCFCCFTIQTQPADFVMNRLAWLAFTLTFILLLFSWVETVHTRYPPPSEKFIPSIKWTMLIVAIGLTVFLVVLMIIWGVTSPTQREGNPVYEVNIIFMVCVQALLSLAFLIYGSIMLWRVNGLAL
jgi:hypothetical protein